MFLNLLLRTRLQVVLFNRTDFEYVILKGVPICQIICEKFIRPSLSEIEVRITFIIIFFLCCNLRSIGSSCILGSEVHIGLFTLLPFFRYFDRKTPEPRAAREWGRPGSRCFFVECPEKGVMRGKIWVFKFRRYFLLDLEMDYVILFSFFLFFT